MRIPNVTVQIGTLVVAAILITTGCSKQEPPTESKLAAPEVKTKPPVLIEPTAGVAKVEKGMDKQQVEATLGKPGKINGKWWVYPDRGMIVAFGDNGVLFNIKCYGPFAGVTKEGIGIGSTRSELLAAYGKPTEEKQFQGSGSGAATPRSAGSQSKGTFDNLWFASLRISFDLQNDKVTSFIVHL